MGGWSSDVSVGVDGISNALIARRVYIFCNHSAKEAGVMWICACTSLQLLFIFVIYFSLENLILMSQVTEISHYFHQTLKLQFVTFLIH